MEALILAGYPARSNAGRVWLRVDLRVFRIRFNERSTRWNLVAHKHRKYLVTRRSVVNGNLT